MAMTKSDKAKAVSDVIDLHCSSQLDNYIRDTVKNKAKAVINADGSAQDVADEVYDLIYDNYSGDETQAAMSMQVFPRSGLTYLRSDIMAALTEEAD